LFAITHFVHYEQYVVSPLCGGFTNGSSWTTDRNAVTCPACVKRLRELADEQPRRTEPPDDAA
jgi:hypothetical protein